MPDRSKWMPLALFCAPLVGCSAVLDLDALQSGESGGGGSDGGGGCTQDSDCDDGIDCTDDRCLSDGSCVSLPDNDLCDYLEMCDLEEGCVPTGKECLVDSDCDDGVGCTDDRCVLGECEHEPDDEVCESADPCMVDEYCHPTLGCQDGHDLACEQTGGGPCEYFACSSSSGQCEAFLLPGADDDEDTYLDADCNALVKGDDCDDNEETIHPGAVEVCNFEDDDCDGLTDLAASASPSEVTSGSGFASPSLAYDGQRLAVAWQRGEGESAEVLARFVEVDGTFASDAYDLTALGGSAGAEPSVAAAGPGIAAVWVASDGGVETLALAVLTLSGGSVVASDPISLATGDAVDLWSPRVAWDGAGWVAAWAAAYGDGDEAVEMQTEAMASPAPGSRFTASRAPGHVEGVSLLPISETRCVLAFSREDASSDGDLEVFEARAELDGGGWSLEGAGPFAISTARSDEEDPSTEPVVAPDGAGGWVTAFADAESTGDPRSILASFEDQVIALAEGGGADRGSPWLASSGGRYGLVWAEHEGESGSIEFRVHDGTLTPVPYQGSELDEVLGLGQYLLAPRLIGVGDGLFAAVWIATDGGLEQLFFSVFEGCVPAEE